MLLHAQGYFSRYDKFSVDLSFSERYFDLKKEMTIPDLKSNIKKKIDEIDNVKLLEEFNIIMNYLTSEKEDWNNLTPELKEAIEEGLEQLDRGNKVTYEDVKKINSRWFST